ncbi:MAG: hypothetical protein CO093_08265 [Alphaproteobacteria bacterium CG_4_9_14_3_um_filter_47_13]|nr:MAG: hypothetical protein CO093_08265 [Alphaproteobacteria bacterium CG_4_9_14_3_um_filter_47_13]
MAFLESLKKIFGLSLTPEEKDVLRQVEKNNYKTMRIGKRGFSVDSKEVMTSPQYKALQKQLTQFMKDYDCS